MSFIKLNDEHRNLLEREIAEFKEALSMPEYQTELKVRQKRIKYYQEDFSSAPPSVVRKRCVGDGFQPMGCRILV